MSCLLFKERVNWALEDCRETYGSCLVMYYCRVMVWLTFVLIDTMSRYFISSRQTMIWKWRWMYTKTMKDGKRNIQYTEMKRAKERRDQTLGGEDSQDKGHKFRPVECVNADAYANCGFVPFSTPVL
jgi:hypothetical protein